MFTEDDLFGLEESLKLASVRLLTIQSDYKIETLRIDTPQEKAVFKISPTILSFIKEESKKQKIFSPKAIDFSFKASLLTAVGVRSLCLLCFLLDNFINSQREKMKDLKEYLMEEISRNFTNNFTLQISPAGKRFVVTIKRRTEHLCFLGTNPAEIMEVEKLAEKIQSSQAKVHIKPNPKGIVVVIVYAAITITGGTRQKLLREAAATFSL